MKWRFVNRPRLISSARGFAELPALAVVQAAAAAAAGAFIRSTEVYQFDLLECPAVAQLRGDPQQGPVYELLSIMLSGDVQVRAPACSLFYRVGGGAAHGVLSQSTFASA